MLTGTLPLSATTAGARLQGDATRETRIAIRFSADGQTEATDAKGNQAPSSIGGYGSTTPSSELGLETVTEESQSWSRKDLPQEEAQGNCTESGARERVDYREPDRKGPKTPTQRRPGRRANSAGLRMRRPSYERTVYCGRGPPVYTQSEASLNKDRDALFPGRSEQSPAMPQLVDVHGKERREDDVGDGIASEAKEHEGGALGEGGGSGVEQHAHVYEGKGVYVRRRLPLKDEFRQMVEDNKLRSEALRRSVEAIESLSGALDANNAEKQLLVKVIMSCSPQGAGGRTPRMPLVGNLSAEERGAGVGGQGRRSQFAFIAQMLDLSEEERALVEAMPATLVDALEDVLRLKMSYAEAVAFLAELDDELPERQMPHAKHGSGSVCCSAGGRPDTVPRLTLPGAGTGAGSKSHWVGEAQDGPVAAAHLRSQLSQVRVENERLRGHLQEVQQFVLGKSPRGRDGRDDGSQLVLDLMHKDLAAAKAQKYVLQAEVASLAEHCKRLTADAEKRKDVLYDQISVLQMELDACRQELGVARQRALLAAEDAAKREAEATEVLAPAALVQATTAVDALGNAQASRNSEITSGRGAVSVEPTETTAAAVAREGQIQESMEENKRVQAACDGASAEAKELQTQAENSKSKCNETQQENDEGIQGLVRSLSETDPEYANETKQLKAEEREEERDVDIDFVWMPAILAHLEGRRGGGACDREAGEGRGNAEMETALDMLPPRVVSKVREDGRLELSAFEALSLSVGAVAVPGGGGARETASALGALETVVKELKQELATYYTTLRSALQDVVSTGPLDRTLIQELRLLQLLVASFEAQVHVLCSPPGAFAVCARRTATELAQAAAAGCEGCKSGRVLELVRELESLLVAAELRRSRAVIAGKPEAEVEMGLEMVLQRPEEQAGPHLNDTAAMQVLPELSQDNWGEGTRMMNSADDSLVYSHDVSFNGVSLNDTSSLPDADALAHSMTRADLEALAASTCQLQAVAHQPQQSHPAIRWLAALGPSLELHTAAELANGGAPPADGAEVGSSDVLGVDEALTWLRLCMPASHHGQREEASSEAARAKAGAGVVAVGGHDDEEALTSSTATCAAGEASSSFCKPSQEDMREPHDAVGEERSDKAAEAHIGQLPVLNGAQAGVEAPAMPVAAATSSTAAHNLHLAGGQRPQSATVRGKCELTDVQESRCGRHHRHHNHLLSPVGESSVTSEVSDVTGEQPPSSTVGAAREPEPPGSGGDARVLNSSMCISDGSADEDEDVLANPELDKEEIEDGDGACSPRQAIDGSAGGGRGGSVKEGVQHGDAPLRGDREVVVRGAVGPDEEQCAAGIGEQDLTLQMSMVQQYQQYEKVGSQLEGVAEESVAEGDEDEADEAPLAGEEGCAVAAAPAAMTGGGSGGDASWERREIEISQNHEPTRPDDRHRRISSSVGRRGLASAHV
jgi:hypothetical protein